MILVENLEVTSRQQQFPFPTARLFFVCPKRAILSVVQHWNITALHMRKPQQKKISRQFSTEAHKKSRKPHEKKTEDLFSTAFFYQNGLKESILGQISFVKSEWKNPEISGQNLIEILSAFHAFRRQKRSMSSCGLSSETLCAKEDLVTTTSTKRILHCSRLDTKTTNFLIWVLCKPNNHSSWALTWKLVQPWRTLPSMKISGKLELDLSLPWDSSTPCFKRVLSHELATTLNLVWWSVCAQMQCFGVNYEPWECRMSAMLHIWYFHGIYSNVQSTPVLLVATSSDYILVLL